MVARKLFGLDQLQFLESAKVFTLFGEGREDKDDDLKKFFDVLNNLASDIKSCEKGQEKAMSENREIAAKKIITSLADNRALPLELKVVLLEKAYNHPAFKTHLNSSFEMFNQLSDTWLGRNKNAKKETGSQGILERERNRLKEEVIKSDAAKAISMDRSADALTVTVAVPTRTN